MAKTSMKPEGMRVEAKMDKKEEKVKQVRIVFLKDGEEFAIKVDLDFLKALRDVAEKLISKEEGYKTDTDRKIPGYL